MMTRYLQLDVFCTRAGGGNPLGVVIGAENWSDRDLQDFARWNNLVETTYLLPPGSAGASYRLRIFTPSREIPFAGHPTVGSAHAALLTGRAEVQNGMLIQECAAGLLPIRVEGEGEGQRIFVKAPPARVLLSGNEAALKLDSLLGGVALGELGVAFVEGGRRWWLVEFAEEPVLRGWLPDHASIGALARATDSLGLCAFSRSSGGDYRLVVRAFPAGVGIVEDPASGAANALIAAYIAQSEPLGPLARGYRVSQGRELGRNAVIDVEIEADGQPWVGGQTRTVLDGRLDWPLMEALNVSLARDNCSELP